jgi:hypothetical protein
MPEPTALPARPHPLIHHGRPPRSRRFYALIIAGAALFLLVFGFGLYRYNWNGGVTQILTNVLPYPAAIVDGHVIRFSDYQNNLTVLQRFYEAERERAAPGSAFPSEAELKARVLDRLIKDQLAFGLADRYEIVVTSESVRAAYDETILDQSSLDSPTGKAKAEARAAETLDDLYGLRPSQFKNRVLHPFLLRQKLEQAIQNDAELNAEKYKKAEAALAELNAGKAFKDVAMTYSEDSNAAATGGDRGMIGRGLLPPEVEAAAFALSPGETSGIVKSALGYHVLRVIERQESGSTVFKVKLQEILVRPIQLDDYLEAQKKTASITVFVH